MKCIYIVFSLYLFAALGVFAQEDNHQKQKIQFRITNHATQRPIPKALIHISSPIDLSVNKRLETNKNGVINLELPSHQIYHIAASRVGFFLNAKKIEYDINKSSNTTKYAHISLQEIVKGMSMKWEGVRFIPNSSKLPESTHKRLNELGDFLKLNATVKVEIGCHTDSRGDADYNLKLSQAQAERIVSFLVEKKGIKAKRLVPKGYGESQLTNHCEDNIRCSNSEHMENRRVELIILDVE